MHDLQVQLDDLESKNKKFSHEEKDIRVKHELLKDERVFLLIQTSFNDQKAHLKKRQLELLELKAEYKKIETNISKCFICYTNHNLKR